MVKLFVDGEKLTIDEVAEVARNKKVKVALSSKAIKRIRSSRKLVEKVVERGEAVYGITTGFGKFQNKVVRKGQAEELQNNLIRSHSVGVGEPFPEEIIRAAILIRANSLAKGYSGVRIIVLNKLIELLNKGIYPYVPQQGSVGSSGDLAPLAHISLVLMGEGEVLLHNKRKKSKEVFKKAGISPLSLSYKEGLALINGTAVMSGIACLNIKDVEYLVGTSDVAAAMNLEAMEGIMDALDRNVQSVRPHQGQIDTASEVRKLCQGSQLLYRKKHSSKVQDSYSLRCIPQVHGTVKSALRYIKQIVKTEINSATDNPLIFPRSKKIISGGNFHGQPISTAMDLLGMVITDLSSICERRIAKVLDPTTNEGLPAFLIMPERAGLNSGFMLAQYTAASLVAENKILAHPVSIDSIPTSANQEDHVSFGTIAARKTRAIIRNTANVIAIELLCAAQACDFRGPKKLGQKTKLAYKIIRSLVPQLQKDRIIYSDIKKIRRIIESGELLKRLEKIKKIR